MMTIRSCGHFVCDEDEKLSPPHLCHRESGSDGDDATMYDELDSPKQSSTISSDDASEIIGGGWSFLVEELQANNKVEAAGEVANAPPPPRRMKRSLSTLSSKSLNMCTEGLGCETGFGITQSIDDLLGNPAPAPAQEGVFAPPPTNPAGRPPVMIARKKFNRTKSFPPPLSSAKDQQARREDGVKMLLRRREGGRLVVTAVCVARPDAFFRENRSDGRLRLSFKMGAADDDVCEESVED
ncbi:unnamed protein product [Cuscuta epithymum]|uniref:FAF domain-containing protein n=1 Tax=Cuscuta epithymum TaxID=186058 RepID=A0AAV0CIP0_9ASTE|nr:unnamed protein product [Cuscuta epithymum]